MGMLDKFKKQMQDDVSQEKKIITGSTIKEIADKRAITWYLKKNAKSEDVLRSVDKFCVQLAKYVHAPLVLKEYERMLKYAEDEALVEVVLATLKQYLPIDESGLSFDVIGHSYALALLSQSKYQREEIFLYFENLTNYVLTKNMKRYGYVIFRNFKTLAKNYPDLKQFEEKLKCYSEYK